MLFPLDLLTTMVARSKGLVNKAAEVNNVRPVEN